MALAIELRRPLFADVRWRIAVMFVALSGVLYLTLAGLAICFFYWSLSSSLDNHLRVQASELGHAIEIDQGGTPHFRDWLRVVQTEPARSLASIQLYDPNGVLLEKYGISGPSGLIKNRHEVDSFRVIETPLRRGDQLLGFLQIAQPTSFRNEAMQKLELTIILLAPVLLLGLGVTSYIVSDAATAPIRENINLLKQFVADASHELNTPISILQARMDVLEKKLGIDEGTPGRSSDLSNELDIISKTTERMDKIVQDLMLLVEVEGTVRQPKQEHVHLDQLMKQVAAEFQAKFDEKGVKLTIEKSEPVTIIASQENLHKVIANLLENAWRYTDPGGTVSVSLGRENSLARLEVSDTGIGIPPESLPLIFERFYRVDKSRSRASGGSGLGLSIVKALVEASNGSVSVQSELGRGSAFRVMLPTISDASQKS